MACPVAVSTEPSLDQDDGTSESHLGLLSCLRYGVVSCMILVGIFTRSFPMAEGHQVDHKTADHSSVYMNVPMILDIFDYQCHIPISTFPCSFFPSQAQTNLQQGSAN